MTGGVTFPVVTDAGFPQGLRCARCERDLPVGSPYSKRPDGVNGDVVGVVITCVYCVNGGAARDRYQDALRVARAMLVAAHGTDPGIDAADHCKRGSEAQQRAIKNHYAAYGVRAAVFAIFPELEDAADELAAGDNRG